MSFTKDLSDERLLDIVRAMDMVKKRIADRFEGDDAAIKELMSELKIKPTLAEMLLVTGEVLRECAHRGLHIPRTNSDHPAPKF